MTRDDGNPLTRGAAFRVQYLIPGAHRVSPDENWLQRWLTRVFVCKLFDGGGRCPYLQRWTVWYSRYWGGLYIHRFIADDWSKDVHDHSSWMVSIGLRGSYTEHRLTPDGIQARRYRAPWIRRFPATHIHRVTLNTPIVWTFIISGPKQRASGFWFKDKWMRSDDYILTTRAGQQKSCGDLGE